MKKDTGCWCSFKFHLPGEKKKHLLAKAAADRMIGMAERITEQEAAVKLPSFVGMLETGDASLAQKAKSLVRGEPGMEEVVTVDLNYQELCTILESGTIQPTSALYVKLRGARDAFRRTPKVYGKGYGIRVKGDASEQG